MDRDHAPLFYILPSCHRWSDFCKVNEKWPKDDPKCHPIQESGPKTQNSDTSYDTAINKWRHVAKPWPRSEPPPPNYNRQLLRESPRSDPKMTPESTNNRQTSHQKSGPRATPESTKSWTGTTFFRVKKRFYLASEKYLSIEGVLWNSQVPKSGPQATPKSTR